MNLDDHLDKLRTLIKGTLRKYGSGHTSGMYLTIDGLLAWILEVDCIHDIVTFPRYPGCLVP